MSLLTIKNNIKGIKQLENIFNVKLNFTVSPTHITVDTDIDKIKYLEDFIFELKKTDIYTNPMFSYVSIKVNILHTYNGNGYHIMLVGSETLNSDNSITRKEKFFAIVHK